MNTIEFNMNLIFKIQNCGKGGKEKVLHNVTLMAKQEIKLLLKCGSCKTRRDARYQVDSIIALVAHPLKAQDPRVRNSGGWMDADLFRSQSCFCASLLPSPPLSLSVSLSSFIPSSATNYVALL